MGNWPGARLPVDLFKAQLLYWGLSTVYHLTI